MLGPHYYHKIIRKTVTAFGTLFNNIYVEHENAAGEGISLQKVPIGYGSIQKFLAKVEQEELDREVAIVLPRLSFEMTSLAYDTTRAIAKTQIVKLCKDDGSVAKAFFPVPWNIGFRLSLLTKLHDDGLQVTEQILPNFRPNFNITIKLLDGYEGSSQDFPVNLDSVNIQDDYEGDFSSRRLIIYTYNFTVKGFLYGPVDASQRGLIRKVIVDAYNSTDVQTATREFRYTLVPDPPDAEPTDDYSLKESIDYFFDGRDYSPTLQQDI